MNTCFSKSAGKQPIVFHRCFVDILFGHVRSRNINIFIITTWHSIVASSRVPLDIYVY